MRKEPGGHRAESHPRLVAAPGAGREAGGGPEEASLLTRWTRRRTSATASPLWCGCWFPTGSSQLARVSKAGRESAPIRRNSQIYVQFSNFFPLTWLTRPLPPGLLPPVTSAYFARRTPWRWRWPRRCLQDNNLCYQCVCMWQSIKLLFRVVLLTQTLALLLVF